MVWILHQPIVLKAVMPPPQSDVYQARHPFLASINACLKLGRLRDLPSCHIRAGRDPKVEPE